MIILSCFWFPHDRNKKIDDTYFLLLPDARELEIGL
jgi:hypothetical protein